MKRLAYASVVSYSQAHLRLKVDRGRPDQHVCPCGAVAREWAYMGGDPDELNEDGKRYSLDQKRYTALCVSCHRRRDRAEADGRSMDVCPKGHPWTPENTGARNDGSGLRYCRPCSREKARRHRLANLDKRAAYAREYRARLKARRAS